MCKAHSYCHGRASVGNIIHRLGTRKQQSRRTLIYDFLQLRNESMLYNSVYEYDINGKAMIETCFGINMCATVLLF